MSKIVTMELEHIVQRKTHYMMEEKGCVAALRLLFPGLREGGA